jgi:uncharacterized sulfatase
MEEMPSMQEMRRLYAAGKLPASAAQFFASRKPVEELYDTQADPDEVRNLANDPQYRGELERLRRQLRQWMLETGDLGLLPEAEIHLRCGQRPPWEYAHGAEYREVLPRLFEAATTSDGSRLLALAEDRDSGVRYWAAQRLGEVVGDRKQFDAVLRRLAPDDSLIVRLAAAETLARHQDWHTAVEILAPLLRHEDTWIRFHAAYLADSFSPVRDRLAEDLRKLETDANEYTVRVVRRLAPAKK